MNGLVALATAVPRGALGAGGYRIVLVEDNPGDAELALGRLMDAPSTALRIETAGTLRDALALLSARAADAIVMDLNLPDSRGLDTLRQVVAVAGDAPIIVLTGVVDDRLREQALAAGAEDVFTKDEANSRLFRRCVLYEIERNRARLQHSRLEGLLDATPDAILVLNRDGEVQYINQAALLLFGRPRHELDAELLGFSATDDKPVEIVVTRPGDPRVCEMRVVPMQWDGEPAQLASVRDITARRQTEELRLRSAELEAQNARISRASQLKSEFLANMSHEIRTPMNAIIGVGYLLAQTRLDSEQAELLGKMQVASRSLMGLISDVLDLSKIEAGEAALEDLPFAMPELLDELRQVIGPLAQSKPLDLVIDAAAEVPRRLRGDITRIRQILVNLLGNAVKFTERGGVLLTVQAHERPDGRVDVVFDVTDTGIGMSPEVLERIFAPFTQADASTTRRFGGSGLGLSIVRQLATLMGGEVQVASELGAGSVFTVRLPLWPVPDAADAARGAHALELLVLEAGATAGQGVCALATALGWRAEPVDPAGGVAQLLQRLRERMAAGTPPDAVVIEPRAQGGDGLHALQQFKATLARGRTPPCLFVVADRAVALQDARQAGLADGLITRPATAAALFNAVNAALVARGVDPDKLVRLTQLGSVGVCCLPAVRVLVVDDCAINRDVARRILEREGAVVSVCVNGLEAVNALRGGLGADAVLMDMQMPVMDGYAATRAIREELGLRDLPILALTASALKAERQRALDHGMNAFITKPLNPEALIRTVRRHVEDARGAALPLRTRHEAARDGLMPAWPQIEGIEGAEVAQRLNGDVALFFVMLGHLLHDYAALAGAERAPVPAEAAGRNQLAGRLHRLRGSAGVLGARRVQRLAGDAETALRAGAADARLHATLAELAAALTRLHVQARPWLPPPAAPAAAAAPPPAGSAGTEPAATRQLLVMLRGQDLAARQRFHELGGALREHLGSARFEAAREAVDRLDFVKAAALIGGDAVTA